MLHFCWQPLKLATQSCTNPPNRHLLCHCNTQFDTYIPDHTLMIPPIPLYTTALSLGTLLLQCLDGFITVGRADLRCQGCVCLLLVRKAKEHCEWRKQPARQDSAAPTVQENESQKQQGPLTHTSFPQGVDPCLHFTGQTEANVPLYEYQIKQSWSTEWGF